MAYRRPESIVLTNSLKAIQGTLKSSQSIDWIGWVPANLTLSVCAYESDE